MTRVEGVDATAVASPQPVTRAILAGWLGIVANVRTSEMARRRATRSGSLAVWRSGATAAVLFLGVLAGGVMPASARLEGDVLGAIATFGAAAEGEAGASAAHHDERVAARQRERVEEHAHENLIAEKTPERAPEKAAQAESPQRPAAQQPAVDAAATVAASPSDTPKEAAAVVVSRRKTRKPTRGVRRPPRRRRRRFRTRWTRW